MKLTKIALGVSIGIGSLVANAADVAMFPYIIDSPSVTTIVTVIDRNGDVSRERGVVRYDEEGNPSESGDHLHWRLHYKEGATATTGPANDAPCQAVEAYLPTSPGDIQTIEMGMGKLTSDVVMFEGANSRGSLRNLSRADSNKPWRGVLFVHNADDVTDDYTVHGTLQGEAMIFEFANGASWGYNAEVNDGGGEDDADDFIFAGKATNAHYVSNTTVSLMPPDEVITQLIVTPVSWEPMLDKGGKSVDGWDDLSVKVGLRANMGDTVAAFDRDGNPVSGGVDTPISCVGAVKIFPSDSSWAANTLMSAAAMEGLRDGGYGTLSVKAGTSNPTDLAIVYKIEYNYGNYADTLNGKAIGRLNFGHKL